MDGSICRKNNCHLCCMETEMDLSSSDISRLRDAGHSGFYRVDNTSRTLINRNGRCIFQNDDGLCSVYNIRPAGCRSYPLIMDLENDTALIDELCPFHDLFVISPEDIIALHTIITELEGE